jgi:hypothetical protein
VTAMNFLYPAFLIGALAVAIPIALHFLRRDIAPEVPFSAVRLLHRSPVARSKRRRLRDLLLLAARVVALLLLAAAFARPYVAGAAGSTQVRLVAIDRSFSMGAPGRFAHALDLARRAIDEASPGERVGVIAFDDGAEILAEPGSAGQAKAALANLQAGFGGTRYGALLAKAADAATGGPARLIVVTDLQRAGWEGGQRALLPADLALEIRDAGAPPRNLSVSAIRTAADDVVASVQNSGRDTRTGQVRLERDGRLVGTAAYVAPPEGSVEVHIPYRAADTGSIAVALEDGEGFAADNRRFAILDAAAREAVLVITAPAGESGVYVARALEATGDRAEGRLTARVVPSASLARGLDDASIGLSAFPAAVVLATRGLERRARESLAAFVRAGGGLLIAASTDVDPGVVSSMFDWRPALAATTVDGEGVALSPTDVRHPIFRPFGALTANLGQVRFDRAWRVKADGWDVVASFTDGSPALLERREGKGRVVLFASDLDRRWNDFPQHPAFVPFALEAVRYVGGGRDLGREYVIGAAPAGVGPAPGVYRAPNDNRTVAVNVDPRESATAALSVDDFLKHVDRISVPAAATDTRARQLESRQSYWQYGLLLMMAALVAESFVGRA